MDLTIVALLEILDTHTMMFTADRRTVKVDTGVLQELLELETMTEDAVADRVDMRVKGRLEGDMFFFKKIY